MAALIMQTLHLHDTTPDLPKDTFLSRRILLSLSHPSHRAHHDPHLVTLSLTFTLLNSLPSVSQHVAYM